MIGMVLAAGAGSRLGDETADLPKTLLEVDGDRTILDIALGNFAHVGLRDAVIVAGHAHDRLAERVPALERRHGLKLELVYNDKALEWNNCYSLWCARDAFSEGVLLVTGALPAGYYVMAIVFGVAFAGEAVYGWAVIGRVEQPLGDEDEEDEL